MKHIATVVSCLTSSKFTFSTYIYMYLGWFCALSMACTITTSIALLANIIILIQTCRKRLRVTFVSGDGYPNSTAAKTKALEDEGGSGDIRPYDMEMQNEQPLHSSPSETSNTEASRDTAVPSASLTIAQQPEVPPQVHHVDASQEDHKADSTPAPSLSDVSQWSITSGTLTGAPSWRHSASSYEK